jgi:hypothetical protein
MAIRTVRLDHEAEQTLKEVQDATGWPISEALKRGLRSLRDQIRNDVSKRPYDVYAAFDLGPGGYARVPSTDVKRGIREALRRKHGR